VPAPDHTPSPAPNRVTPTGEIVAIPLRGAWTGNRGILHAGREITRLHAHEHWLTCALRFRGWWHEQWRPSHFTWLFFQDEAVSLAAGHRPCALCRRPAYNAFRTAWANGLAVEVPSAQALDHQLHGERIVRGTHRRRTHPGRWPELPDGTFVIADDGLATVVRGDRLIPWTTAGYGKPSRRPSSGSATVLTPPASVAALRAGYPVQLDPATD